MAAVRAGCALTGGMPTLALSDVRVRPVRNASLITGYELALVSVADVMERELGLPPLDATLHFYGNRESFQAALEAEGYTPAFAADAAARLSAIGGFKRVLLNDATLRWLAWPQRLGLLAHELTHTIQYDLSGGLRGTSDQWLREGFAEWVEVRVADRLGLIALPQVRPMAIDRVRRASRDRAFPPLAQMATFEDWVGLIGRHGEEGLYAHALLAAERLVQAHGVPAVLDYFRLFASSPDRAANFRAAFGQDRGAFDESHAAYVASGFREPPVGTR
jgi:hypothetical protein